MKKNILQIKFIIIGVLLLGFASCEEFLNVNDNPNEATKPSTSGLLANAIYQTFDINTTVADITSLYVQHLAGPSPSNTDKQFAVYLDATWFSVYKLLADLQVLEELAQEQEEPFYEGVAKILTAANLGLATDLWGDIPYSEALQGALNTQPKFDTQQQLYGSIQTLLNEAITVLNSAENVKKFEDFVHQGDPQAWIKTAYALKARYLNHLTKKADYKPADVLDAVSKAYSSNNDDAQMFYTDEDKSHWTYLVQYMDAGYIDGYFSDQFIKTMDGTYYPSVGVDPRLLQISEPISVGKDLDGKYRGTVNGKGFPSDGRGFSKFTYHTWYARPTSPILLITNAEVNFIEAEAALLSNNKDKAYQAYMDGIKANMDKLGVPAANRDAYVALPEIAVGKDNLTLSRIMHEKWIALFVQPEAWTDARRFDYKYANIAVPFDHNPSLQGNFIRRILYPETERSRNGNNVPKLTGIADGLGSTLWWDTK